MRSLLHAAVLLLPACFHPNYDHAACSPHGGCPSGFTCVNDVCVLAGGAGDGSDASVTLDALRAADAPGSRFCGPMTGLVACYEFEGNAKDGSGNGLDATTTNVTFAPGRVGQAMLVDASSSATVKPNFLFDEVGRFTVEAWIQPAALATSGSDILRVISEYGLTFTSNGTLACGSGAGSVETTTVPVGQWTHVACTYDGAATRVYINGSVAGMQNSMGLIYSGGDGMRIAVGLIGLIDQLRLLDVGRSAAEICADAGKTSCP